MHLEDWKALALVALASAGLIFSPVAIAQDGPSKEPLVIQEQGSFAVGGTVVRTPGAYDR